MKPIVKCKQCGARNDVDRIFCVGCGARLDISKVLMTPTSLEERTRVRRFFGVIESLLSLAIFVALVLVLWPVAPTGKRGSPVDAQLCAQKVRGLYNAVEYGQPVKVSMSDAELNAYFAAMLAADPEAAKASGRRMAVGEINLTFSPEFFVALVLANWGPVRLSYELRGWAGADDGDFRLEVLGLRWGHLPLPGPAARWMAGRMGGMFGRMERERRVLGGVRGMKLGPGWVSLQTGRAR
jgi:hypothetical protein